MTAPRGGRDVSASGSPEVTPDVLDSSQAGGIMLRGSAIRSIGYVAGVLLALISAPLLVRHLGVVRLRPLGDDHIARLHRQRADRARHDGSWVCASTACETVKAVLS